MSFSSGIQSCIEIRATVPKEDQILHKQIPPTLSKQFDQVFFASRQRVNDFEAVAFGLLSLFPSRLLWWIYPTAVAM